MRRSTSCRCKSESECACPAPLLAAAMCGDHLASRALLPHQSWMSLSPPKPVLCAGALLTELPRRYNCTPVLQRIRVTRTRAQAHTQSALQVPSKQDEGGAAVKMLGHERPLLAPPTEKRVSHLSRVGIRCVSQSLRPPRPLVYTCPALLAYTAICKSTLSVSLVGHGQAQRTAAPQQVGKRSIPHRGPPRAVHTLSPEWFCCTCTNTTPAAAVQGRCSLCLSGQGTSVRDNLPARPTQCAHSLCKLPGVADLVLVGHVIVGLQGPGGQSEWRSGGCSVSARPCCCVAVLTLPNRQPASPSWTPAFPASTSPPAPCPLGPQRSRGSCASPRRAWRCSRRCLEA